MSNSDTLTLHAFDVTDVDIMGHIRLTSAETEVDARDNLAWEYDFEMDGVDNDGVAPDEPEYIGDLSSPRVVAEVERRLRYGDAYDIGVDADSGDLLNDDVRDRFAQAKLDGRKRTSDGDASAFTLGFPLQIEVAREQGAVLYPRLSGADLQVLRDAGHEDILDDIADDVRECEGARYEVLVEADGSYQVGSEIQAEVLGE